MSTKSHRKVRQSVSPWRMAQVTPGVDSPYDRLVSVTKVPGGCKVIVLADRRGRVQRFVTTPVATGGAGCPGAGSF